LQLSPHVQRSAAAVAHPHTASRQRQVSVDGLALFWLMIITPGCEPRSIARLTLMTQRSPAHYTGGRSASGDFVYTVDP
jgi:hypothetical protein